jgi:hypothetical protein
VPRALAGQKVSRFVHRSHPIMEEICSVIDTPHTFHYMPIGLTHRTPTHMVRLVVGVAKANALLRAGWSCVAIETRLSDGTASAFRFTMRKKSIISIRLVRVAKKVNRLVFKFAAIFGISFCSNPKKSPSSFEPRFSLMSRRCFPESFDSFKIRRKWRTHK